MSDETTPQKSTEELAEESIQNTLLNGHTVTADGVSRSNANIRDAAYVADRARLNAAARAGRRPLLRGINLSGVRP